MPQSKSQRLAVIFVLALFAHFAFALAVPDPASAGVAEAIDKIIEYINSRVSPALSRSSRSCCLAWAGGSDRSIGSGRVASSLASVWCLVRPNSSI